MYSKRINLSNEHHLFLSDSEILSISHVTKSLGVVKKSYVISVQKKVYVNWSGFIFESLLTVWLCSTCSLFLRKLLIKLFDCFKLNLLIITISYGNRNVFHLYIKKIINQKHHIIILIFFFCIWLDPILPWGILSIYNYSLYSKYLCYFIIFQNENLRSRTVELYPQTE